MSQMNDRTRMSGSYLYSLHQTATAANTTLHVSKAALLICIVWLMQADRLRGSLPKPALPYATEQTKDKRSPGDAVELVADANSRTKSPHPAGTGGPAIELQYQHEALRQLFQQHGPSSSEAKGAPAAALLLHPNRKRQGKSPKHNQVSHKNINTQSNVRPLLR